MEGSQPILDWLERHYQEMERDLLSLLAIDSVQGPAAPGAPFGPGPARALDYCLALAERQGFAVGNMDGYMGLVDMAGEEPEQVGVLSHVDVVAAAPADWRFPPFTPTVAEGMIWGRGVIDDKGPLIACQYALAALKECGIKPRRSIRHLLGTNEETGMACIDYFVQHSPVLPARGFAPDAVFPVVAGEKGLLRWSCSARWPIDEPGGELRLERFVSGSGINCVPALATAELTATDRGWQQLQDLLAALPPELARDISLSRAGERVTVRAEGVAAHAALPEKGDNAIAKVLRLLSRADLTPQGARGFIRRTASLLADWRTGRSLGIYLEDAYSSLTNLLSLIEIEAGTGSFFCDTRYPVTCDGEELIAHMERVAAENGLDYSCWHHMVPLFYPEEHPLIDSLLSVYREFTGDMAPPKVIGSGTYARKLPDFVAFGPLFPGRENITHQADERLSQEDFRQLARIYAAAIYRLANS